MTIEMLIVSGFAITLVATAINPKVGVGLGCLSPILAFVATVVTISLWPSGSSTDALEMIWVPIWVACGAIPAIAARFGGFYP